MYSKLSKTAHSTFRSPLTTYEDNKFWQECLETKRSLMTWNNFSEKSKGALWFNRRGKNSRFAKIRLSWLSVLLHPFKWKTIKIVQCSRLTVKLLIYFYHVPYRPWLQQCTRNAVQPKGGILTVYRKSSTLERQCCIPLVSPYVKASNYSAVCIFKHVVCERFKSDQPHQQLQPHVRTILFVWLLR